MGTNPAVLLALIWGAKSALDSYCGYTLRLQFVRDGPTWLSDSPLSETTTLATREEKNFFFLRLMMGFANLRDFKSFQREYITINNNDMAEINFRTNELKTQTNTLVFTKTQSIQIANWVVIGCLALFACGQMGVWCYLCRHGHGKGGLAEV